MSLDGRHVYLRPVLVGDYAALSAAEQTGELAIRWRFRGATPSPERWVQNLWQNILAQFIVVRRSDNRPLGLVMSYRADFQDGHAHLAIESFDTAQRGPHMMLGGALFIEYVFNCWDFHKLYLEVPEFNMSQIASGVGRLFAVEGRKRDHTFYGGRRWDEYTLALYRDTWRALAESRAVLAMEARLPQRIAHVRMPAPKAS
ncbi:MAG: GNAT family N-acetyltransferase [Solirubrobacteraceae bacterium]